MTTLNTLELDGADLEHAFNRVAAGLVTTTDDLLTCMHTVLAPWGPENQQWSARAKGCGQFATGDTPLIAMRRALVLRHLGPTVKVEAAAAVDTCDDLF